MVIQFVDSDSSARVVNLNCLCKANSCAHASVRYLTSCHLRAPQSSHTMFLFLVQILTIAVVVGVVFVVVFRRKWVNLSAHKLTPSRFVLRLAVVYIMSHFGREVLRAGQICSSWGKLQSGTKDVYVRFPEGDNDALLMRIGINTDF